MADAQLSVELRAQVDAYLRNMQKAGKATKDTGSIVDSASGKIASALAGAFSVSAIVGFGKAVLDATAEYQKFQAVLGNTLGSSALANLKLKELQEFAANTPFGVNELTGAFVKLANSGFKPTGNEMRKLGDLAASTGKSFDQLAEAIIDAQTGEFERLKEFGVRAKDAGDSVIFTYKGVQTQVDKTSESIRNYITSLGDAEGTSGAMAKISETLGGKISNLGDSWDQMLIVVGGNTEGIFNSAIDIIGTAINSITKYNKELQLASKYKLGGGFTDALKRFAQGIATGGNGVPTQLETLGLAAETASDKVSKLVAETIRGAKNTGDFGKAIKNLKTEADRNLKNIKIPGLANAFKDIYEEGFKALQDARTNFNKELNKPSSNFGTSKKDKGLKIKAPELELPDNPQKIISDLFRKLNSINAPEALKVKLPKGVEIDGATTDIQLFNFDPKKLAEQIKNLGIQAEIEKLKEKIQADLQSFFSFENINTTISSGLGSAFEAVGEAFANGGNVIEAFGKSILSSIGGVLIQFGSLTLAAGIAATALGKALSNPLNPASAGVAIAAGAALIAIGAAVKGFAGGAGKGKSGGNYDNVGQIRGFATGGYNLPGGMALVGEKGPELLNIPTGASIDNNNRTNRILASGNRENVVINGNFEIGLEKLYFRLEQTGKKMGRKV